ncbi:hypothetical protein BM527_01055 [Alteromonas sp. Mex14]|nr:hypothetical protein BM527_01055 [Alteromonas sp. Mex14]
MAFMKDNKAEILAIIHGWQGKLTLDLLSKKIKDELGLEKTPNRGTYRGHDEIFYAYKLKKKELKEKKELVLQEVKQSINNANSVNTLVSKLGNEEVTAKALIQLIEKKDQENERLSSENAMLKHQNDILLERFARWQHNLQKMDGVDLNKLAEIIDDGLPAKNRY